MNLISALDIVEDFISITDPFTTLFNGDLLNYVGEKDNTLSGEFVVFHFSLPTNTSLISEMMSNGSLMRDVLGSGVSFTCNCPQSTTSIVINRFPSQRKTVFGGAVSIKTKPETNTASIRKQMLDALNASETRSKEIESNYGLEDVVTMEAFIAHSFNVYYGVGAESLDDYNYAREHDDPSGKLNKEAMKTWAIHLVFLKLSETHPILARQVQDTLDAIRLSNPGAESDDDIIIN